jgi:hypothetical protein
VALVLQFSKGKGQLQQASRMSDKIEIRDVFKPELQTETDGLFSSFAEGISNPLLYFFILYFFTKTRKRRKISFTMQSRFGQVLSWMGELVLFELEPPWVFVVLEEGMISLADVLMNEMQQISRSLATPIFSFARLDLRC